MGRGHGRVPVEHQAPARQQVRARPPPPAPRRPSGAAAPAPSPSADPSVLTARSASPATSSTAWPSRLPRAVPLLASCHVPTRSGHPGGAGHAPPSASIAPAAGTENGETHDRVITSLDRTDNTRGQRPIDATNAHRPPPGRPVRRKPPTSPNRRVTCVTRAAQLPAVRRHGPEPRKEHGMSYDPYPPHDSYRPDDVRPSSDPYTPYDPETVPYTPYDHAPPPTPPPPAPPLPSPPTVTYPWRPPPPPPERRRLPRRPALGNHSDLRILRGAYRCQRRVATTRRARLLRLFLGSPRSRPP